MKMPLSEILDRYTITRLKSERTNEDVSDELQTYKREVDNPDYSEKSTAYGNFFIPVNYLVDLVPYENTFE